MLSSFIDFVLAVLYMSPCLAMFFFNKYEDHVFADVRVQFVAHFVIKV